MSEKDLSELILGYSMYDNVFIFIFLFFCLSRPFSRVRMKEGDVMIGTQVAK